MSLFGFCFRATEAYTSNPANNAAVTATPTTRWPTVKTINAVNYTVGYANGPAPIMANGEVEGQSRDRRLDVDARLAGVFQCVNRLKLKFTITLPSAGRYRVWLACGDAGASGASKTNWVDIYDGATLKQVVAAGVATGSANFIDATGVNRTVAAWPANNAPIELDFSTTEFIVYVGRGDGVTTANDSAISYLALELIPPSQTITSINSGAGITPGSTGNTAAHTGFSGVPTAETFGGKSATNIAGTSTDSTFDFPYYVDLATYPQPGTSPNFIATRGAETATLSAPLNYRAGETGVTVASPDTTNDKKLGYWILQAGRTITNGDMLIYTIADVTGSADSGFTAAAPLTTVIWHWIQSTGVMYQYNVTITEAGISEALGLTSVGLTSVGLTSVGLTSAGL